MHRYSAINRRQALLALTALVTASASGCSLTTPLDATLPPTPTVALAPVFGGTPPMSMLMPVGTPPAPGSTPAAMATILAAIPPMPPTAVPTVILPTLPPASAGDIATGTAISATSVSLSGTATAAANTTNSLPAIPTGNAVTANPGTTSAGTTGTSTGTTGTSTTGTRATGASTASVQFTVPTDTATATAIPMTPTVTPVPATVAPATQASIDRARARFDKVNALHFALGIEGLVYIDAARSQRLLAADGDLLRPDRVSATGRVAISSINVQLKFIQIADAAYLTSPITGRWQNAPAGFSYDPRIVFDPANGVTAILGRVNTWVLVDIPKVGGVDTQHLHGVVPTAAVDALVTNSLRGDNVDVDVYIEGKNSDVVRLILAEQPAAITDGTTPAKWTLDLSKQNEALKIDAPMIGVAAPRSGP